MCTLETGLVGTGLTNQLYRWIVVLCNAIVRPLTATALEKPCSLIAEALGAMHADLILTDSCEESD